MGLYMLAGVACLGALAGWWVAWQGWLTVIGQVPLLRFRAVGVVLVLTGAVAAAGCVWLAVSLVAPSVLSLGSVSSAHG